MKATLRTIAVIALLIAGNAAIADKAVKGHVRKDGTYVEPHYRTNQNQWRFDNYSSKGNANPYTGAPGTKRHEFTNPPAYNKQKR